MCASVGLLVYNRINTSELLVVGTLCRGQTKLMVRQERDSFILKNRQEDREKALLTSS